MDKMQFKKIVARSKKRVGRGHGSGKVKTGGRGTKGQRSRESIRFGYEGGQLALIHRLPFLRGKRRNKPVTAKAFPIAIDKLSGIKAGSDVTLSFLKEQGIVPKKAVAAKILGGGKLEVALTVSVPCSASAKAAIEKAGGKVAVA